MSSSSAAALKYVEIFFVSFFSVFLLSVKKNYPDFVGVTLRSEKSWGDHPTSHGEPTNLFGASYMPLSFFPGCCPLAFGSQYRTKIPGGSEPWVPIVGRRRLQVPEDSEVLPFALQFFQTERKKVSTQFFPTSRNLGLSP